MHITAVCIRVCVCMSVCACLGTFLFVISGIYLSYGDITIAGEHLQMLTYARQSWPLSSEVSLACHTFCDTGQRDNVYNGCIREKTSLLNGHNCRAKVKICSPSPVMMTSPYGWKISSEVKNAKQINKKQLIFYQCSWHLSILKQLKLYNMHHVMWAFSKYLNSFSRHEFTDDGIGGHIK